ncbi:MAG: DUF29 domain-containing protein [Methylococcaceae bacterium]|nr:DUF29 domain-containing protein [Methylococcaceae bacterium]
MSKSVAYQEDFHAWIIQSAALIRQGRLSELDLEHIAEELESMGASERRELLNRLQILLMHLLKYQFQPERRGKSWKLTMIHQRTAIERLLKQSPSLKRLLEDQSEILDIYQKAVREAVLETDLGRENFPLECPYTIEEILNDEFWPE